MSALGAASVSGGLVHEARATAPSTRPLRFIGLYTPHGRAHELWRPAPGFDISYPDAILRPFDDPDAEGVSLKQQLVVIDGVDLAAGIEVGTTGHDGPRVILTGSGANGKNSSIDQYLALERGLGADTPHSTVVLAVGSDQPELGSSISYGPGGTAVPKWIDPAQTFTELFGAALSGKSRARLAEERARGKSVLDALRSDLSGLARRVPRSERWKLEQHHGSLREIEKRLTGPARHCEAPAQPDARSFPKQRAYGGGEPFFDVITDLQIDLLVRAMACDLTRFGTLVLSDLSRTRLTADLPDDVHADVAHRYDARTDKHPGTPASWLALANQNRYAYRKVARLLGGLARAGLLDDTIVYVSGDMGDPARHSSRSVPTLIAGGAAARFRLGRYLDLRGPDGSGVPNNRILVSICQAFGVEAQRFGSAKDSRITHGRLEELHVSA